jgi:hypothetical protein
MLTKLDRIFLRFVSSLYLYFSKYYLNYYTISKSIELAKFNSYNEHHSEIGIVIQGPIVLKNNFTIETLKLYKKLYPNIIIVLSTWKGLDKKVLREIGQIKDVYFILSDMPENKGINNINLQIKSTTEGVEFLERKGCKYVLKTRTDQRLETKNDFINLFLNFQQIFPFLGTNLQKRLIISSLNTLKKRYYGISDMLMFGTMEDMKKYWCVGYENKSPNKVNEENEDRFFIRQGTSEGYLVMNFMQKINYIPIWTELDHRKFIAKYFAIIDYQQVNHFWFKYNWWIRTIETDSLENNIISFSDWLEIKINESI